MLCCQDGLESKYCFRISASLWSCISRRLTFEERPEVIRHPEILRVWFVESWNLSSHATHTHTSDVRPSVDIKAESCRLMSGDSLLFTHAYLYIYIYFFFPLHVAFSGVKAQTQTNGKIKFEEF